MLSLPGTKDYLAEDATDCRNYGGLQGLAEVRRLFSGLMGAPPEQIVASNNSSLAMMHDTIVYALLKGTCDSITPWSAQGEISFSTPFPGYDRHFQIYEDYGIRLIPVALRKTVRTWMKWSDLVAGDASIRASGAFPSPAIQREPSMPMPTVRSPSGGHKEDRRA